MRHIYIIQNQINFKIYIGQTKNTHRRWLEHQREARNLSNPNNTHPKMAYHPLYKSMKKNGIENFSFEVIESFDTLEEANEAEIFWIQYFQSNNRDWGYNIEAGGNNKIMAEETRQKFSKMFSGEGNPFFGKKHSEETRTQMSIIHTGYKHTPEAKQKMSESRKGEKNRLFGKTQPPEVRKKISEALTGRKLSSEQCQKMSEIFSGEGNPFFGKEHTEEAKQKIAAARTGTKHKPETIQKMSEQRSGENNGMFGQTHTPEARKKIADAQRENIKTRPRDSKGRLIKIEKV